MHADAMPVLVFNTASVTHPLAFWLLSSQLSSNTEAGVRSEAARLTTAKRLLMLLLSDATEECATRSYLRYRAASCFGFKVQNTGCADVVQPAVRQSRVARRPCGLGGAEGVVGVVKARKLLRFF